MRIIKLLAQKIYIIGGIGMSHNFFDDDVIFENYKAMRSKTINYNNLMEQPSMKLLLPDLKNKVVLDMGCGFGINCVDFIKMGASKVVGIDISKNMLSVAMNENANESIQYILLDMDKINEIDCKFDFVYSSLTLHYIADFENLIKKVHYVLNNNGVFLFSQEHPMRTAPLNGQTWINDEQGNKISAPISNYSENGERNLKWMNGNRIIYHRSFSVIVNNLVENGFSILKIVEPAPTAQVLEIAPYMYDEIHRPTAIIIKTQKQGGGVIEK
jgi:SAM-dependent methyltransferase